VGCFLRVGGSEVRSIPVFLAAEMSSVGACWFMGSFPIRALEGLAGEAGRSCIPAMSGLRVRPCSQNDTVGIGIALGIALGIARVESRAWCQPQKKKS
jgi:hypothetical protein